MCVEAHAHVEASSEAQASVCHFATSAEEQPEGGAGPEGSEHAAVGGPTRGAPHHWLGSTQGAAHQQLNIELGETLKDKTCKDWQPGMLMQMRELPCQAREVNSTESTKASTTGQNHPPSETAFAAKPMGPHAPPEG
eukprot:1154144-Pelagomonas_calceolata.AAC.1